MTPSRKPSRRSFLGTSAAAGAAAGIVPFRLDADGVCQPGRHRPAGIGCIGVGSMGTGDAQDHAHFGDIVAVCDVDSRHAERAKNDERIGKGKADIYGDYRQVLDRDDIDVVSIVTPDHWHVKIAIEALEAGKHVFCQKPLTLTLEENQLIRNACKKYPRAGVLHRHPAAERPRPLPARGQHGAEGPAGRHQEDHRRHQRQPDGRAVPRGRAARGTRLGDVARPGSRGRLHRRSGATTSSAGGTSTPAASSPTGAPTTSTSPMGPRARQAGHGAGRDRRHRRQASGALQGRLSHASTTATTPPTTSPSSARSAAASR